MPSIPLDGDVLTILHYDGDFQSDLKHPQYIGGRQKMRHLRKTITYNELVNVALEELNWETSVEALCIRHLFHNGSFFSLIDIDDDNDVKGMFRASRTDLINNILMFVARREGDAYATKETPETRNHKRQRNQKAKQLVIGAHTKEFPTINLNEDCDFNFPLVSNGMIGVEEPIIRVLDNDASMALYEDVHYFASIPSISRHMEEHS